MNKSFLKKLLQDCIDNAENEEVKKALQEELELLNK
tara:strand:- start:330 stop:437 length:108 start_codon:yes stop_codon:yes gene_type:complete